jgi:hypothetical protein
MNIIHQVSLIHFSALWGIIYMIGAPGQGSSATASDFKVLADIALLILGNGVAISLLGKFGYFLIKRMRRRWNRYDRTLVCRVLSRTALPFVNGGVLPVKLDDRELEHNGGIVRLQLKNIGTERVTQDDILNREFSLTFGDSKVITYYEPVNPDAIELNGKIEGNKIIFSPQFIDAGTKIELEAVLAGYDARVKAEGRISKGGPIKMEMMDEPSGVDAIGDAFLLLPIILISYFLFLYFLSLQFYYSDSLARQILCAIMMGMTFAIPPYSVFVFWLKKREEIITGPLKPVDPVSRLVSIKRFIAGVFSYDFVYRHRLVLIIWLLVSITIIMLLLWDRYLNPHLYSWYQALLSLLRTLARS